MLPVKLKLVSIKNILSRWLHIGCLASHIIFTCWPTQRVGLSHFLLLFFYRPTQCVGLSFFFTGQLNVLAYLFFLLANSTCWPISFFLLANSMCWPFVMQLDGSHRLLLVV